MLKPVEGGWHAHKIDSTNANRRSAAIAAMAQHGGAQGNVFNPIGTNPVYGDQPVKPVGLINPNAAAIGTYDNRAPQGGTTGDYQTYSSMTEIPQGSNEDRGMQAEQGKLALALQGKSYYANLNNPMGRGQELYG